MAVEALMLVEVPSGAQSTLGAAVGVPATGAGAGASIQAAPHDRTNVASEAEIQALRCVTLQPLDHPADRCQHGWHLSYVL